MTARSQRGKEGYINLLAYIKANPSSIEAVQEAGLYESQASRIMWALHRCALLHIIAWEKSCGGKGHYRPVFAYGPGDDEPEPVSNADGTKRRSVCRRVNASLKPEMMLLSDLMRYMREVPCTVAEAASYLGQHTVTVGRLMRALSTAGLTYVHGWEQGGKRRLVWVAEYMVGDGKSKPKPRPYTVAEHNRKQRARLKVLKFHSQIAAMAA